MDASRENTLNTFHDSLERCGSADSFLRRFYDIFVASSPAVAEKFADTDFRNQTRVLKTSFYLAMLASDDDAGSAQYLQRIAARHNRDDLDIPPEHYALWLDSLLMAVSEFDPRYSPEVEQAWRAVMQPAIDYMQANY